MDGSKRQKIIGGNWKCNGSLTFLNQFTNDVLNKASFDETKVAVVVAPVSIHISSVKALLKGNIRVACQNMSGKENGAFTGEVSSDQLKDFGIDWVIIGHSERRSLFGETNEEVSAKVTKAQAKGLNAIICIGE